MWLLMLKVLCRSVQKLLRYLVEYADFCCLVQKGAVVTQAIFGPMLIIFTYDVATILPLNILARLAKLPTGIYILLLLISSFFTMSKAIWESTGPIFIIFSPNGRYLHEFSRSVQVFPIPQVTLPWQPICGKITYPLHLLLWHFETEWDITTSMCVLTA